MNSCAYPPKIVHVCVVCVLCIYVFSKLKYTQCMYTCGLCMHICRCAIVCICVCPYLHLLYCALQSTGLTIPENTENEMFACANVTQVNGNKNTRPGTTDTRQKQCLTILTSVKFQYSLCPFRLRAKL